jgi:hypothetical protein
VESQASLVALDNKLNLELSICGINLFPFFDTEEATGQRRGRVVFRAFPNITPELDK